MTAPAQTAAPATTEAPAPAAAGRKKLPPINKLHTSKEALDAAQKDAREKGHSYDTRKFKVTANGKTAFVLGYSPANAAGTAYEAIGIQVEELDPSDRKPFEVSKDKIMERVKGMSKEDQEAIAALLASQGVKVPGEDKKPGKK